MCTALSQFNNKTIGQVASDILLLLCDHAYRLKEHYPEIPSRIIEVGYRKNFILKGNKNSRNIEACLFSGNMFDLCFGGRKFRFRPWH
jgi:hypothetical protein